MKMHIDRHRNRCLLVPNTHQTRLLEPHSVIPPLTATLRLSEDFQISMIIYGSSFSMAHLIERWCGYCFSFRKVEFNALAASGN